MMCPYCKCFIRFNEERLHGDGVCNQTMIITYLTPMTQPTPPSPMNEVYYIDFDSGTFFLQTYEEPNRFVLSDPFVRTDKAEAQSLCDKLNRSVEQILSPQPPPPPTVKENLTVQPLTPEPIDFRKEAEALLESVGFIKFDPQLGASGSYELKETELLTDRVTAVLRSFSDRIQRETREHEFSEFQRLAEMFPNRRLDEIGELMKIYLEIKAKEKGD